MTIRILLRALPLFLVAVLTLGVFLRDMPAERGQELARLHLHQQQWMAEGVNCPKLRDNPDLFMCPRVAAPTKPGAQH